MGWKQGLVLLSVLFCPCPLFAEDKDLNPYASPQGTSDVCSSVMLSAAGRISLPQDWNFIRIVPPRGTLAPNLILVEDPQGTYAPKQSRKVSLETRLGAASFAVAVNSTYVMFAGLLDAHFLANDPSLMGQPELTFGLISLAYFNASAVFLTALNARRLVDTFWTAVKFDSARYWAQSPAVSRILGEALREGDGGTVLVFVQGEIETLADTFKHWNGCKIVRHQRVPLEQ